MKYFFRPFNTFIFKLVNRNMLTNAEPYSNPIISNVTLIGRDGNTQDAMRLRRGTKGQIWNSILSGYGPCVKLTEEDTFANVTDGSLALHNMVFNCTSSIPDGSEEPEAGAETAA